MTLRFNRLVYVNDPFDDGDYLLVSREMGERT